jgi:hypothetical protein
MAYLQITPLAVLAPAVLAALSTNALSARVVTEARNAVVREAALNGRQIPVQDRATKYESLVLRITEHKERTVEWKAAAIAELAREEANRAREGYRTKRVHNARVGSKVSKRKSRATKRAKGLPSPPHKRAQPHSSDEAAEAAAAAVKPDAAAAE